jgi:hypothetical protein
MYYWLFLTRNEHDFIAADDAYDSGDTFATFSVKSKSNGVSKSFMLYVNSIVS